MTYFSCSDRLETLRQRTLRTETTALASKADAWINCPEAA